MGSVTDKWYKNEWSDLEMDIIKMAHYQKVMS